ncbi:morphogenetic protein [Atlantibacter hermannii]|uniref:morphogenetic protein n=1 Tax=Atlantibacter hermannii TaxID=565 RepID=UPI0028A8728C|nr:morphogenetic protein [Atlantibacter hermannii]
MKERGMIFNGEMVRAILDGRKTQTRRIVKLSHERGMKNPVVRGKNGEASYVGCRLAAMLCPFGQPGDRIWVRETFQGPLVSEDLFEEYRAYPEKFEKPQYCEYAADGGTKPEYCDLDDNLRHGWRPSIHMPRWASRILLEITDVRVEQLASISTESARAEGYPAERAADGGDIDPWLWFRDLWDGIYPEQTFKHNPWVWVVAFKRIEGDA